MRYGKKIFVIGVYSNVNNTKENLEEENILEYLDNKKLMYNYLEVNIDSDKELNKTIDFFIKDGIKNLKDIEGDKNFGKDKSQNENGSDGCDIF